MRLIRRWSTWTLLVAALGCGSDGASTFGSPSGGNGATGGSGGAKDGGGIITTGGNTGGAGGGVGGNGQGGTLDPDARICGGIDVGVETLPLNMLIMFDQSSSMTEFLNGVGPPNRWDAMTGALLDFFQSAEAQPFGIGLAYFEQIDPVTFGTSCRVSDYSTPEVEIAPMTDPGQVQKLVDSIRRHSPTGLTPTGPALQGALDHAKVYAMAHPGRQTVVVLATDGIPTQCTPSSSYDIAEQLAAPAFKGVPSIRTMIVAAATGLTALGVISTAGGTGQPVVVTDPATTSSSIKSLFQRLGRTNFACSYRIPLGSDGGRTDPGQVNVVIHSPGMADRTLRLFASATSCGDGWYYDKIPQPENIMLCPDTCASLFNGELRIVVGCAGPPPM